jgi:hypothetical protein
LGAHAPLRGHRASRVLCPWRGVLAGTPVRHPPKPTRVNGRGARSAVGQRRTPGTTPSRVAPAQPSGPSAPPAMTPGSTPRSTPRGTPSSTPTRSSPSATSGRAGAKPLHATVPTAPQGVAITPGARPVAPHIIQGVGSFTALERHLFGGPAPFDGGGAGMRDAVDRGVTGSGGDGGGGGDVSPVRPWGQRNEGPLLPPPLPPSATHGALDPRTSARAVMQGAHLHEPFPIRPQAPEVPRDQAPVVPSSRHTLALVAEVMRSSQGTHPATTRDPAGGALFPDPGLGLPFPAQPAVLPSPVLARPHTPAPVDTQLLNKLRTVMQSSPSSAPLSAPVGGPPALSMTAAPESLRAGVMSIMGQGTAGAGGQLGGRVLGSGGFGATGATPSMLGGAEAVRSASAAVGSGTRAGAGVGPGAVGIGTGTGTGSSSGSEGSRGSSAPPSPTWISQGDLRELERAVEATHNRLVELGTLGKHAHLSFDSTM